MNAIETRLSRLLDGPATHRPVPFRAATEDARTRVAAIRTRLAALLI